MINLSNNSYKRRHLNPGRPVDDKLSTNAILCGKKGKLFSKSLSKTRLAALATSIQCSPESPSN